MQTRKSVYSTVNYILSILFLGLLIFYCWNFLSFCRGMQDYDGFLQFFFDFGDRTILTILSFVAVGVFILCFCAQVLLTALSMGRRDKYTDIDYGFVVEFNYVVLVVYGIYMLAVPCLAIYFIVT